jgi:hypothetical protein
MCDKEAVVKYRSWHDFGVHFVSINVWNGSKPAVIAHAVLRQVYP